MMRENLYAAAPPDEVKVELLQATCLHLAKQVEACLTHLIDLNARVERLEGQKHPKLIFGEPPIGRTGGLHRGPGPI